MYFESDRPQYLSGKQFRWIGLLAFNVILAGALYATNGTVDPVVVAFACFTIFIPPAVVFHELGHALAAKWIKARVIALRLGLTQVPTGPHFSFHFLGLKWEIYALPISGSVLYVYPNSIPKFRRKAAFVTAAAPLTNLALAALALPLALHGTSKVGHGVACGWIATNLFAGVMSLMPFNWGGNKRLLSDGGRILNTIRLKNDEVAKKCQDSVLIGEVYDEKEAMQKLTADEAIARYETKSGRIAVLATLVDKLTETTDPRQYEYVTKLLAHPDIKPENAGLFLDNYITGHLNKGTINGNAFFDSLSERLLMLSKNSVTVRGTRGSVLIDLGRMAEGREILKAVLKETKSKLDRIYVHIFLALASKAEGDAPLARKHAVWARKLDRHCPALKRISDLLPA